MKRPDWARAGQALLVIGCAVAYPLLSLPCAFGQGLTVTKTDELANDADGDGRADAGDVVRYTITITNTGDVAATGVVLNDTPDSATGLVENSLQTTPLAANQTVTLAEDGTLAIQLSGSDADGDDLTFSVESPPTHGGLDSVQQTNATEASVTYTPAADYNGADQFVFAVSDPAGGSSQGTVRVEVTPVNDPPMAMDDLADTDEDTSVSIDVRGNDFDPDDTPAIVATGNGTLGNATLHWDGNVLYRPRYDANGEDTFTYTLRDAGGATATARVNMTIRPVNDLPEAMNDYLTGLLDETLRIPVLDNDLDPDGETDFTVLRLTELNAASISITEDNHVLFTPAPGNPRTERFFYTMRDAGGLESSAEVRVHLTGPRTQPIANEDWSWTPEEHPVSINVLANDRDFGTGPLSVYRVDQPSTGRAVIEAGGTITYTPAEGFSGTVLFTYGVRDGAGWTGITKVHVTVAARPDYPEAVDDNVVVPEGSAINVDVLANDTHPDTDPRLGVVAVTPGLHGSTGVNRDNTVRYVPDDGFTGEDNFVYTTHDRHGYADMATVRLVVVPLDSLPVAVDDTVRTQEDVTLDIHPLANDLVPDGASARLASHTTPPHGEVSIVSGNVARYTPAADYHGTDAFDYTLAIGQDAYTATVEVTVAPVPDAPRLAPDDTTLNEDTTATIDVLANDSDPDDGGALELTVLTAPPHGTAVLQGGGTVQYTPTINFWGEDAFSYTVVAENGLRTTSEVRLLVRPVNDPPTATNASVIVTEDTPQELTLGGADPDGDFLTFGIVEAPAHGTVGALTVLPPDQARLVYTPDANYNGSDAFTFSVEDPAGDTAVGTVEIDVQPVNDPPENLSLSNAAVAENEPAGTLVGELASDDADPNASHTYTLAAGDGDADNGLFAIDGATLRTASVFNFEQQATRAIRVRASDGLASTERAFTINVTDGNDPPTELTLDNNEVLENEPEGTLVGTLSVSDEDTGDSHNFALVSGEGDADNGLFVIDGATLQTASPLNFEQQATHTIRVRASDGLASTERVFTINVTDANDPPTGLTLDNNEVLENEPVGTLVGTLSVSDEDNGDSHTFALVSGDGDDDNSQFVIDADRLLTGSVFDFETRDVYSILVEANDGTAAIAQAFGVRILDATDDPVAVDDAVSVEEDSADNLIDVLTNDIAATPTDQILTLESVGTPSHGGSVAVDGTQLRYTPAADFFGAETFAYTIRNQLGLSDEGVVTVTVTNVNDDPTAQDDTATVAEDSVDNVLDPLANDEIAPDADETLTITSVGTPDQGGTVSIVDSVSLRYSPAADFFGEETFSYAIADGNGGAAQALMRVTVTAVNDDPVANDDTVDVDEDAAAQALDVLANDSTGPDAGETLSISSVGAPSQGGSVVIESGTSLRYTPASDFFGAETFTYTISDGNGGSAQATVTVNVNPVNDDPVGTDDLLTVVEDSTGNALDVLANDTTGPDTGETLTITGTGTPDQGGSVTTDGAQLSYAPAPDFFGVETFTYTLGDGNGGSSQATVTVTVANVNDDPHAVDDAFDVPEDTPETELDVLANDTDAPDVGETLTITAVGLPDQGGAVTISSGTSLRYSPPADFLGVETFTYTIADGNGGTAQATVTVTVTSTNDDPTAVDDSFTVDEDTSDNTLDVLANDTTLPDTGETLSITAVGTPDQGGTVSIAANALTYTPAPDFFGAETFAYTISDGNGGGDQALVTVTVNNVNDDPVAADDTASVMEDAVDQVLDVLANDTGAPDAGETLVITSVSTPDQGGTVTIDAGAALLYTPAADFFGVETFTYTISDGNGGTDQATVTVTVSNVNDDPTAVSDTTTVSEDSADNLIDVLVNDTFAPDTGETLTITSVSTPDQGGTATIDAGAALLYTPSADFFGVETFTYAIGDGNGGTDQASVTVTVTNVNDDPTAADDTDTVPEDTVDAVLEVLANDTIAPDASETLTITATSAPSQGGSLSIDSGSSLLYTPQADFFGVETFTYDISDGNGGTDQATVTITVTNVNDDPTATDDTTTVIEDSTDNPIDVLSNDVFTPDTGETLTITAVGTPDQGGSVTIDGGTDLLYTPASDFFGTETFTYTIGDGNGGSDQAIVTVTVQNANDDPIANDDSGAATEDSVDNPLDVLANDTTGADTGETLTITAVGGASHGGAVSIVGGASLLYTPAADFFGTETFTYDISDGNGGTAQATVTMTVSNVNDDPSAGDDTPTVLEDSANNTLSVLANDTDAPDTGETLTITAVGAPDNGGAVSISAGTTLRYTPVADFYGVEAFTYNISDGNGGTDQATVSVTVVNVNDAPSFTKGADETAAWDEGLQTIAGWATAISPGPANESGQTVSFLVSNDNNALFAQQPAVSSTGTLTYDPASGAPGTATVSVRIQDNGGTANGGIDTSAAQNFDITVIEPNEPPVTGDDTYDTTGNTLLEVGVSASGRPSVKVAGQSVLDNDTDADSEPLTVTTTGTAATTLGGTVTMGADGSFSYVPPVGVTSSADSFSYTATDGKDSATATVVINTAAQRFWYVENNAAAGGSGLSTAPFDTLAEAIAALGAGDTIYVLEGDGTDTGQDTGVTAVDGLRLLGEGVALSASGTLNGVSTPVLHPAETRPAISNNAGVGVAITDVSNVEVRGLDITGSTTGMTIAGTDGSSMDAWVAENAIRGTASDGILISNTSSGAQMVTLENCAVTGANGLHAAPAGGTLEIAANGNTFTGNSATGATIDGSGATVTVTGFNGNTAHENTAGDGIVLNNLVVDATPGGNLDAVNFGTTTVGTALDGVGGAGLTIELCEGDITFDALSIRADGGRGMRVTGNSLFSTAAGLRVNTPNTASVSAAGGGALSVDTCTMVMAFADLTSTGSASQGLDVTDATGSLSVSAGTLSSASGSTLYVSGGDATVTYEGDMANTSGRLIEVSGTTGGNVTLQNGTLSDTGTATNTGTGVLLTNVAGNVTVTSTTTLTESDAPAIEIQGGSGTFGFTNTSITNPTDEAIRITGPSTAKVTFASSITKNNAGDTVYVNNLDTGGFLTLNTTTLDIDNGDGLYFQDMDGTVTINNADMDNTSTGITVQSGGGTFNLTDTNISGTSARSMTVLGGACAFNFDNLDIVNTNPGIAGIASNSSGTLTIGNGSTIDIWGKAVDLTNVPLNVVFDSLSTTNADDGIRFNGPSGTFTVNGGAITGSTSDGLEIENSTATITLNNFTVSGTNSRALKVFGGQPALMLNNTSVSGSTGGLVEINNVTGGGITCDASTTFTATSVSGGVHGIFINANNSNYAAVFDTVTINAPNGGSNGIYVTQAGVGSTFTFNSTTTVSAAGDRGIFIEASSGTFSFNSIDIDNTGASGISVQNTPGSVTISGGSLDAANGTAFEVNQSDPTVICNAALSNTTNRVVEVTNMTGGSITFGGTISDTGGSGINVASNGSGVNTITFNGAVTLGASGSRVSNGISMSGNNASTTVDVNGAYIAFTSSGSAISASGSGLFTIDAGSVDTANAPAMNLAGVTTGITLANVTVTNSNGDGISLGIPAGSLTVTGTTNITNPNQHGIDLDASNAAYSFGTINISSPGNTGIDINGSTGTFSLVSAGGAIDMTGANDSHGVQVQNSANVTISGVDSGNRLTIRDIGTGSGANAHAVNADTVSGITLEYLAVDNVGTLVPANAEHGVSITDPAGATVINDCVFTNIHAGNGVSLDNTSLLVAPSLNVTNCQITAPGNNGVLITDFDGDTITFTASGNTITSAGNDGIRINTAGTSGSGARNNLLIQNNVITSCASNAVEVQFQDSSVTKLDVDGNTLNGASGNTRVVVVCDDAANADAFIQNSTTISSSADRGILAAMGAAATGVMDLLIDNNAGVSNNAFEGIHIYSNGSGTLNATITGNSLSGNGLETTLEGGGSVTSAVLRANVRNNSDSAGFYLGDTAGLDFQLEGSLSVGATLANDGGNLANNGNTGAVTTVVGTGNGFTIVAPGTVPAPTPLMAVTDRAGSAPRLTQADLRAVLAEAFRLSGASVEPAATRITDLPGAMLGRAFDGVSGHTLEIDADAAGWGWHTGGLDSNGPNDRMDLLTAVLHELAHLRGTRHSEHSLMAPALSPGQRKTGVSMRVESTSPAVSRCMGLTGLLLTVIPHIAGGQTEVVRNIGTLEPGQSVTVTFDVRVGDPLPEELANLLNQATVVSSEGTVLSDDPDIAGDSNPTATPVDQGGVTTSNSITTITGITPATGTVNQPVTVNYTVAPAQTGLGVPTGQVIVSDGEVQCTGAVSEGVCVLTPQSAGVKTITAVYQGDSVFETSMDSVSYTVREEGACDLPDAPAAVNATDGLSYGAVLVTWETVADAARYQVYRSATEDFATATAIGASGLPFFLDFDAPSPSERDNGCRPGETVAYYWVVAENDCGLGAPGEPDLGFRGYRGLFGLALFEAVLPGGLIEDSILETLSDTRLAIRLRHPDGIDLDSITCEVTSIHGTRYAFDIQEVRHGDLRDLWVVHAPETPWALGDTVTMRVSARSETGDLLAPEERTFEVVAEDLPEKSDPVWQPGPGDYEEVPWLPKQIDTVRIVTTDRFPASDDGVGPVYEIGQWTVFQESRLVWLPVPEDAPHENLWLYYYHQGASLEPGWYPADYVEGFLVPDSYALVEIDGQSYLGFQANHAGVLQFGYPPVPDAGIDTAGLTETLFILVAVAFVLLFIGRLRTRGRA